MEAKAKLLGHPIHQMLIVFPLGLLATAVVFDAITLLRGSARWTEMAFYLIGAGLLGGLLAAVFGLIDFLGIPAGTRAKRIGALHGICNLVVVIFFGVSWFLRRTSPDHPSLIAYVLSYGGAALSTVAAWMGGELVDRLGVGVHPGANVNAPSSLHASTSEPSARIQ